MVPLGTEVPAGTEVPRGTLNEVTLRTEVLSACGYLRVDRHVCRFFDFSYHLLTALSQLISPRLQDLESLLTLATAMLQMAKAIFLEKF